jgi:hypothetical protein
MLCPGPGPPLLLHLTRANAEKPYAMQATQILFRKLFQTNGKYGVLYMYEPIRDPPSFPLDFLPKKV